MQNDQAKREIRFVAHAAHQRKRAGLAAGATFVLLALRDLVSAGGSITSLPFIGAAVIFAGLQIRALFVGAKALTLSANGIAIESGMGGQVTRLTWREIKLVEVRRGVWNFVTRAGKQISWSQADFDGGDRTELESELRTALQSHSVPFG